MRRRSRASMSAPRRCRTAAGASSRPSGCGRPSPRDATPIAKVHVSDQGHFGFARIDAAEQGLAVVGSRGAEPFARVGALVARFEDAATCACSAPLGWRGSSVHERSIELIWRRRVGGSSAARRAGSTSIDARLVVAADGIESAVRRAFGVEADVRDYHQTAVITTVLPNKFHDHVAYERFTASGPLALLPLADGRCTLVLTLTPRSGGARP